MRIMTTSKISLLLVMVCMSWSVTFASSPDHLKRKDPIRVVLDPGHGGSNQGAPCGQSEGCFEKDLTLPIALKTEGYLRSKGVEVYLTRRQDMEVSISDRVQFANQVSADVLVSIHLNASDEIGPSGFMKAVCISFELAWTG